MTLDEALSELLPGGRTGNLLLDLLAAAAEAWRRRQRNTIAGAVVLRALLAMPGMSYRRLQREIGIPRSTAQRWAIPPEHADDDRPALDDEAV